MDEFTDYTVTVSKNITLLCCHASFAKLCKKHTANHAKFTKKAMVKDTQVCSGH